MQELIQKKRRISSQCVLLALLLLFCCFFVGRAVAAGAEAVNEASYRR